MNYKDKRIAIIGAGPGGLTLARILQQGGLTHGGLYDSDVNSKIAKIAAGGAPEKSN